MSASAAELTAVPAEVSLEAIGRLLDLGRSVGHVVAEPDWDQWRTASAGLFMRVLTLAETTMHVSRLRRTGDLSVLARCLYEHAVVLAWIAVPRDDSRWEIWNRESLRRARVGQRDESAGRW